MFFLRLVGAHSDEHFGCFVTFRGEFDRFVAPASAIRCRTNKRNF